MTPEEQRKELATSGQDPFMIAALVLDQNRRLQAKIEELQNRLREMPQTAGR